MFVRIKSFFSAVWHKVSSFFKIIINKPHVINNKEKYDFVKILLQGQKNSNGGFALRHVDSHEIKNNNISHGFLGDAMSYSITPFIMNSVLNIEISNCSWITPESGEILFIADNLNRQLDEALAVKIFDCLHEKILKFIKLNFSGYPHHFMLIKDMNGAVDPYDINEIYPTGKCGKQNIQASQIVKVFSKENSFKTSEDMLQVIEKEILKLNRPLQYSYSQESATAILSVLREIKLSANDDFLAIDDVHKRLINAEIHSSWSDFKYHIFHDNGGYLDKFKEEITHVNEDLGYFKLRQY